MNANNEQKQGTEGGKIPLPLKILGMLALLVVVGVALGDKTSESPKDRPSPDGSGWYKDSGLTNAQVIEINEFCRDNPDSWKCK